MSEVHPEQCPEKYRLLSEIWYGPKTIRLVSGPFLWQRRDWSCGFTSGRMLPMNNIHEPSMATDSYPFTDPIMTPLTKYFWMNG